MSREVAELQPQPYLFRNTRSLVLFQLPAAPGAPLDFQRGSRSLVLEPVCSELRACLLCGLGQVT